MSVTVLIVIAVAIPLGLVASALVANFAAAETEQPLSRGRRVAVQAFLVILSILYTALAVNVGVATWVDGRSGSSLALVLIFVAFGIGPVFHVVQLNRPHQADHFRKRRYVAQGYAFIASAICWAV